MSVVYGYLDTEDVPLVNELILDVNTSTNLTGDLTKIKWYSPTPTAIADVVYAEMDRPTAMAYYKNPENGWVPLI